MAQIDMIGKKKEEIPAQKVSRHFSINIFFKKIKMASFRTAWRFISFPSVVCRKHDDEKSFFIPEMVACLYLITVFLSCNQIDQIFEPINDYPP
jgi:hypothetical protein